MRNKGYLTRIRCSGSNLINFINNCSELQLSLEDLIRIDARTIEFSVNNHDYKLIKTMDTSRYQMEIIRRGGLKSILNIIRLRIGLLIGLAIACVMLFMFNNRLINIEIMGLNNIDQTIIEKALSEYGIKKYSQMDFDNKTLENYLYEKFDFSFVSIITKGNSLIINVKEEINNISPVIDSITAPYNMIIKTINVFSGTSRVKSGDIVFKGDILIEPYEIINNERIEVEPCGIIEGDTYFTETYNFNNEEEVLVKTGKSKTISSSMSIGKLKLFESVKDCDFVQFEIVDQKALISEYFIPLRINKTIAYEQKYEKISHDFEKEKDKIIENLKDKVYNKVPDHLCVENEEIKISPTNYGNIVTIYLKSSVYLKYNIN